MRHPAYCYVDFGRRSVADRYILKVGQIAEAVEKCENFNCFQTWYRFPRAVKEAGTLKGYHGPCMADYLPFDFDCVDDPGQALGTARSFVSSLQVDYEVEPGSLLYYFSGKKGIHVLLPAELFGGFAPSADLPGVLKKVAEALADGLGIDPKIYDRQRFLRIENTKHRDSGLYRIPLSAKEFLYEKIEWIIETAKAPRSIEPGDGELVAAPGFMELYQKHSQKEKTGEMPKQKTVDSLFAGGLKEGDGRDEHAFKLACYLRDSNVGPSVALKILRLWDQTNEVGLADTDGGDVLQKKIANAYGASATDGLVIADVKSIGDLAQEYSTYIAGLKTRRVLTGYPQIDKGIRGIAPGELLFIIARPNIGKSALLQNIQRKMSAAGQWSLFISLEQPLPQCFERFAQMSVNMEGQQIEDLWQDSSMQVDLESQVVKGVPRVLVMGKSISVADIPTAVQLAEEKLRNELGQETVLSAVLVDYLGYLRMNDLGRTIYEQVSTTARQLKVISGKIDRALICAAQVSRGEGDATTPLKLSSARDSGAIEESGDFVIGLYRETCPPIEGAIPLIADVLKNRKGKQGIVKLILNQKSLRIEEASSRDEYADRE